MKCNNIKCNKEVPKNRIKYCCRRCEHITNQKKYLKTKRGKELQRKNNKKWKEKNRDYWKNYYKENKDKK